jgi:hypothetical protein
MDYLAGYGSEEEDDAEEKAEMVVDTDRSASSFAPREILAGALVSRGTKRGHSESESEHAPATIPPTKAARSTKSRFVPPQVKLKRPNQVTEDQTTAKNS